MRRFSTTETSSSRLFSCGTTPIRRRRGARDHPHRGGLAGAVRPEEAEALSLPYLDVHPADRLEFPEPFGETACHDDAHDGEPLTPASLAPAFRPTFSARGLRGREEETVRAARSRGRSPPPRGGPAGERPRVPDRPERPSCRRRRRRTAR